jgi:hypothetical protein
MAPGEACHSGRFKWMCRFAATGHPVRRTAVLNRNAIAGGKGPESFPPLMEQAANLAGAAVRYVASGLRTTTKEEQVRRLSICRECPEFVGGKCRICGCFLMAKVRSAAEHCPLPEPRW